MLSLIKERNHDTSFSPKLLFLSTKYNVCLRYLTKITIYYLHNSYVLLEDGKPNFVLTKC